MTELTLGGYMRKHERAAAFGGSDGQPNSVAIYVEEEPDLRGMYGAAHLFVRWSPAGYGADAARRPYPLIRLRPQRNRGCDEQQPHVAQPAGSERFTVDGA